MANSLRDSTVADVGLRRPIRMPFERWPNGTDIAIALLALVLTLSMWESRNDLDMDTFNGVGSWLAAFVASFALLWRRSQPTPVHALVLALSILLALTPLANGCVALSFTLYSIGRYESHMKTSVLGLSAALVFLVFDLKLFTEPTVGDTLAAVMAIAIWYLGRRLRFRGEYLRLLEERAHHLERQQHAEAERAVAAERTRIAREMHDVVAHQVSLMTVQAGAARTVSDKDPTAAGEAMAAVETAGRQALTEMRNLLGVLRPDDKGDALAPQPGISDIPALIEKVREVGPTVTFEQSGDAEAVGARQALAIYRIVQEALTNVIKHAGDNVAVSVTVAINAEDIETRIKDNGLGAGASSRGGHGIVGMRERADLLGGTLTATANDAGFSVIAVLPVEQGGT